MGGIGSPWQNRSCTWRNDFSMNNICSQRSYWLGRSRNTQRWPKIFKGFDSVGIGRLAPTIIAEPDFGFWPHWSTWVCTGQVFFLAAACTHMPDGKPSGKSVLVGMRYKTLPSQDEVLAPCHPQIRKMQQTHNSKKVTLQLFLEWFAWARWGFCQPTPPLCAHHTGSIPTKADQFFQEGLLKSINAGLRTDLVARAFTKDNTKNFEETSTHTRLFKVSDLFIPYRWVGGPLKPLKGSRIFNIRWRSLKTFERVTFSPSQKGHNHRTARYPLQYPIGSMIFLYTYIWLISGKCKVNIPVHRSFLVGDILGGKHLWLAVSNYTPWSQHSPWKSMVGRWSFPFGKRPMFKGELFVSGSGFQVKTPSWNIPTTSDATGIPPTGGAESLRGLLEKTLASVLSKVLTTMTHQQGN